ncbi:armadillo-type protein [Entophlyctis helioformis]|nr:armadillo-type protein [Entophlyctis helioformis]
MASFVSNFASTLSKALGPQGPPLPFSIGPMVQDQPGPESPWALHSGTRKDDQSQVAVFVFDIQRNRDKLPLAQNSLRRAKTIRHPDVLRFIDGCETDTQVIIGTEPVVPLAVQLRTARDDNLISFGLHKIASALKFLNVDCSLIHGSVRLSSVFTTPAGEWKIGGLDFLCSLAEDNPPLIRYAGSILAYSKYSPPEFSKDPAGALRSNPMHLLDTWGYACLIHEVFNGPFSRPDDLGANGRIPASLASLYQKLRHQNPKMRPNFERLLVAGSAPGAYFHNDFIMTSLFLEQIALKDAAEKDSYLTKINLSVETFPIDFCKYKILPEIIKALEFGGAGAKALNPILKIGSRLSHAEFDTLIVPIVVKLFSSPDRAIRVTLCENLTHYIGHLSQKIVSDKIFPNLATGFGDTSAIVRESTLKSIPVIIPKLSERIINNDLLRYLARLQADEEPGIRTNTTICIGNISRNMSDAVRKKVLVTAFVRSLHDPFPPARNAGLLALAATVDQYDPAELAQRVLPSVSPLLLDSEKSIRTQALKNMALFLKRIEAAADAMPETAQLPANGASQAGAADPAAAGANGSADGWAGWAISAVSSRLGGSGTTPRESTSSGPTSASPSPTGGSATALAPVSPANGSVGASAPQSTAGAAAATAAKPSGSVSAFKPSSLGLAASASAPGAVSSFGSASFGSSSSSSATVSLPPKPAGASILSAPSLGSARTATNGSAAKVDAGWDVDDWGMDEPLDTKPPSSFIPTLPPPPPSKPAAKPAAAAGGWDTWDDDWSGNSAPAAVSVPASVPSATVPSDSHAGMTPAQRREALAAQREARKAARMATKQT